MDNDTTVAHAGCVAESAVDGAGCVAAAGKSSQAAAPPNAVLADAGCAAVPDSSEGCTRATPPTTVRELERALRGLGFTRLQASSIARRGFSGANAPETIEPQASDNAQLREALQALARSIQGNPS